LTRAERYEYQPGSDQKLYGKCDAKFQRDVQIPVWPELGGGLKKYLKIKLDFASGGTA
jgi:hypothetical protein